MRNPVEAACDFVLPVAVSVPLWNGALLNDGVAEGTGISLASRLALDDGVAV